MSYSLIQSFRRIVIIQKSTFSEINTLDVVSLYFLLLLFNHRMHENKIKNNIFQILEVSIVFQWEPNTKPKRKAFQLYQAEIFSS